MFQNILWKSLYAGIMTAQEKNLFISNFSMPTKGYGNIQVQEKDIDKTILILKEHVGEFEFEYYEDGFISSDSDNSFYYGKFEIDDLHDFIHKLINNDIIIINIGLSLN